MSASLLDVLEGWNAVATGAEVVQGLLFGAAALRGSVPIIVTAVPVVLAAAPLARVAISLVTALAANARPPRTSPEQCAEFLATMGYLLIPERAILFAVSAPLRTAAMARGLLDRFSWGFGRIQNMRRGSMGNKPGRFMRYLDSTEAVFEVVALLVIAIIATVLDR